MGRDGTKLIAIGIVLSHEQRKKKVEMLNYEIDQLTCNISSPNMDGMPHGTSVGDPVSSKLLHIQDLEDERDIEQNRVNAVEWAFQYVTDTYDEKYAQYLRESITLYLSRKYKAALLIVREKTDLTPSMFRRAKNIFINQILFYLNLQIQQ